MLRQINVSGFKSLDDFELKFNQGLNVIVGPNGSGKTNIINFIEFISFLSRDSLLEAEQEAAEPAAYSDEISSGALRRKLLS
jgi:AAA15 family ATPase/GTPase